MSGEINADGAFLRTELPPVGMELDSTHATSKCRIGPTRSSGKSRRERRRDGPSCQQRKKGMRVTGPSPRTHRFAIENPIGGEMGRTRGGRVKSAPGKSKSRDLSRSSSSSCSSSLSRSPKTFVGTPEVWPAADTVVRRCGPGARSTPVPDRAVRPTLKIASAQISKVVSP